MMEKIIDLTEYYPNAIKAEQKGNDILILRKLEKPFKNWQINIDNIKKLWYIINIKWTLKNL